MARRSIKRIGDLQLRILKVLWQRPQSSVAEVQQILGGEPLAYTTVATMLRKMEARGLVRHQARGRQFIYQALVSDSDVTQGVAHDLVERLFGGSLAAAVSHLLETHEVSRSELDDIERLIRARKKGTR